MKGDKGQKGDKGYKGYKDFGDYFGPWYKPKGEAAATEDQGMMSMSMP